jgi:HEPN domain-containing protein
VEKAIKAVLETLRIEYPLSHDLVQLLVLLGERKPACPATIDEVKQLNPFAVRFRYDDLGKVDAPSPALDRAEAVRAATLAVAWARGLVQP